MHEILKKWIQKIIWRIVLIMCFICNWLEIPSHILIIVVVYDHARQTTNSSELEWMLENM